MKRLEKITKLNQMLLDELPEYQKEAEFFPQEEKAQRRLLRSLMNVRPPMPLNKQFIALQDELLSEECENRGVVDGTSLPSVESDERISIWQGDITRLKADAIVDADNSALLGCFCPCHGCIDNAIHSAAGLQLRDECNEIMQKQGYEEPTGHAKLTKGYNLPARYVLHTVGPVIYSKVTDNDRRLLASCYKSCLTLAEQMNLESVAFCCISTGEYNFPNKEAALIAVSTVKEFLITNTTIRKVIFNVFKDYDAEIYRQILGPDRASSPQTE